MIISYGLSFHYIYVINNTDDYIYNLITKCNYNGVKGWHRVETSSNSTPPSTKVENIDNCSVVHFKGSSLSESTEELIQTRIFDRGFGKYVEEYINA